MLSNLQNKKIFKGDTILWYVVIALMLVSVMVVYSSTGKLAYEQQDGNTMFYLIKQFVLLIAGVGIMIFLQSLHYKYILSLSKILIAASFILLILVSIVGEERNETTRVLPIPFIGYTFQPAELAKLALIVWTARAISFNQGDDKIILWEVLTVTGILSFIIFLENFSTSVLIWVVCMMMLFIGNLKMKNILLIISAFVVLIGLILLIAFTVPAASEIGRISTIRNRVTDFFSDNKVKEGYSYQSEQTRIAVARGGLFGVGPGNSVQRNYLPQPYMDCIYAIIIEEYGSIGGGIILLLYLVIFFRVGVIVRRCTRTFPALLVAGLGLSIVVQAFVNMAVSVGVMPITGQTLPLVSMGGTSILFTCAAFGMILSIAHTFDGDNEDVLEESEVEEEDVYEDVEEEDEISVVES
ncbi:MAG: FtsW/RodA/SpoVE family cell cycle protein [Culturomica sp.]|jgi:cell division protein FtsW|nr:FtsW/RodA/SpoVE family cell cycle protein [Culturomica sp.]